MIEAVLAGKASVKARLADHDGANTGLKGLLVDPDEFRPRAATRMATGSE